MTSLHKYPPPRPKPTSFFLKEDQQLPLHRSGLRTRRLMRELYLMHCGDLNGKEVQKGGSVCICMADSFCWRTDTNTTLENNCTPVKLNLKREGALTMQTKRKHWPNPAGMVRTYKEYWGWIFSFFSLRIWFLWNVFWIYSYYVLALVPYLWFEGHLVTFNPFFFFMFLYVIFLSF